MCDELQSGRLRFINGKLTRILVCDTHEECQPQILDAIEYTCNPKLDIATKGV